MIYTFKEERHSFLSNMALVDIEYNGHTFISVENAYQAQKLDNDKQWLNICLTVSPYEVKKQSNGIKPKLNWSNEKLKVMEDLLRIKFSKHPFKQLLIGTGNQNI